MSIFVNLFCNLNNDDIVVIVTATTVVTATPTAFAQNMTGGNVTGGSNVTGGLDVLIEEEEVVTEGNVTGGNMTTTTGGGGGDQETANKQLAQAMKALEAGDNAVAEEWMKELDKTLSGGEAKMHLGEAMKALQAGNIEGAMMHIQAAQGSLAVNIS